MNKKVSIQKLAISGVLIALAVAESGNSDWPQYERFWCRILLYNYKRTGREMGKKILFKDCFCL